MEDKTVMDVFKNNLLTSITAICEEDNDEEFAIQVLDVLLDKMWSKEEIINVINETLENEADTDNEEYSAYRQRCHERGHDPMSETAWIEYQISNGNMNANDDEHRRQFERDVL